MLRTTVGADAASPVSREEMVVESEDGSAVFSGLGGGETIQIERAGYAKASIEARFAQGVAEAEFVVEMGRGATIEGVVRDGSGAPVGGAYVVALPSVIRVASDESGRYRIDGLPAGPQNLFVGARAVGGEVLWAGLADSVVVTGGQRLTLDLVAARRAIEVRGRVLCAGQPLSADVAFERPVPFSVLEAAADDEGNFDVRLPRSGRYVVNVAAEGCRFERTIDVPAEGLAAVEIASPKGGDRRSRGRAGRRAGERRPSFGDRAGRRPVRGSGDDGRRRPLPHRPR